MDYTASARCLYTVELLEAEVTSKENEIGPDDPITTKSQVIQSENTFGELYACMMPCLRTVDLTLWLSLSGQRVSFIHSHTCFSSKEGCWESSSKRPRNTQRLSKSDMTRSFSQGAKRS